MNTSMMWWRKDVVSFNSFHHQFKLHLFEFLKVSIGLRMCTIHEYLVPILLTTWPEMYVLKKYVYWYLFRKNQTHFLFYTLISNSTNSYTNICVRFHCFILRFSIPLGYSQHYGLTFLIISRMYRYMGQWEQVFQTKFIVNWHKH